jgi:DNA-binding transcriptional LysR family regulator
MSSWEGIEEIVAIEAAGSFVGAAAALGVSTSHISRAVARFESAIQAQVFHRTTRQVSLTNTGSVLVEQFRRIIAERDEAIAAVSSGGEPQGEVRVTCSTALGERFVSPILQRFAQRYPRLSISLELTNRVVDLIAEGFDLAIRTGHLADSRLIGTRIASRGLCVCASPQYLESHAEVSSITDLAQHECLIGTSTTWHFKFDGEDVTYRPKGRWRCNSGPAIVDAAVNGMGICQLPEFYVAAYIRSGRLIAILDNVRAEDQAVWAVYPQRRHLMPKVRSLVDELRNKLGPALIKRVSSKGRGARALRR